MVVQAEHGGQPALGAGGLEEVGLGGRAVGELPGQVLDVQTVVLELVLDLGPGNPAAVGLEQAVLEPLPGLGSPAVEVAGLEPGLRNESRAGPSPASPAAQGPYAPIMLGVMACPRPFRDPIIPVRTLRAVGPEDARGSLRDPWRCSRGSRNRCPVISITISAPAALARR